MIRRPASTIDPVAGQPPVLDAMLVTADQWLDGHPDFARASRSRRAGSRAYRIFLGRLDQKKASAPEIEQLKVLIL